MPQHIERQILEGTLIVEGIGEPVHIGADLCKNIVSNQIDGRLSPFGDRLSGQSLAQHQRQCRGKRHVFRFVRAHYRIRCRTELYC